MKNTVTPKDLIYSVRPRTTPFGFKLFGLRGGRLGSAGVYRVGQTFGGRIAMY
ncbi:MAG: hypothetical protein Q8P68_06385 [Candidatus Peregrinibacteria bacterium]|nr:hypothetical protein [Candidatus Peregrinibacteria bacterium]MDZ4244421.1 hypothetical protein [Candidatus Gracilibacteria bacterium]